MAESPDELYARVRHTQVAAASSGPDDAAGRLPVPDMTDWDTFPFESDDLRVKPLDPPVEPEPPRVGDNPSTCFCQPAAPIGGFGVVWRDEHWHLKAPEPTGSPLVLVLEPHEHLDVPDLPDDLAAELGLLTVRLCAAVEALPHVGRCHVSRWGDGGAHAHVWFFARPYGFPQLRGTFMAVWDDLLPPVPRATRDADARAVIRALVQVHGGSDLTDDLPAETG